VDLPVLVILLFYQQRQISRDTCAALSLRDLAVWIVPHRLQCIRAETHFIRIPSGDMLA
jgi:hypothetical protein